MATNGNVVYKNGKYYTVASPHIAAIGGISPHNPFWNTYVKSGLIKELGAPSGSGSGNGIGGGALPTSYTPNQHTQAQLSGMNNMQTPQWMMDAYTRKIQGMGGNANPPVPFGVTQSGFPGYMQQPAPQQTALPVMPQGSGGKNPAINQAIQGVGPAALGGINALGSLMGGKPSGTSSYLPSMGPK